MKFLLIRSEKLNPQARELYTRASSVETSTLITQAREPYARASGLDITRQHHRSDAPVDGTCNDRLGVVWPIQV